MKQALKKTFALLLTVCMLFGVMSPAASAAPAAVEGPYPVDATYSPGLYWMIDNGKLIIFQDNNSGAVKKDSTITSAEASAILPTPIDIQNDGIAGAIPDYSGTKKNTQPWYGYKSTITSIEIRKVTGYDGITAIGASAFEGLDKVTSVAFTGGTVLSDYNRYDWVTGTTTITSPVLTPAIGDSAFAGMTSLTTISLPQGYDIRPTNPVDVTIMGGETVSGVTTYYLGESISTSATSGSITLGNNVFDGCTALTTVDFGGATELGDDVLKGCSALKSVDIGEVTVFGTTAPQTFTSSKLLADATKAETIEVASGNASYTVTGNVLIQSATDLVYYPPGRTDESFTVTSLSTITAIGAGAFANSTNLKYVNIGVNVTAVGSKAFENCKNLVYVRFGDATATTVGTVLSVAGVAADAFDSIGCTPAVTVLLDTAAFGALSAFPSTVTAVVAAWEESTFTAGDAASVSGVDLTYDFTSGEIRPGDTTPASIDVKLGNIELTEGVDYTFAYPTDDSSASKDNINVATGVSYVGFVNVSSSQYNFMSQSTGSGVIADSPANMGKAYCFDIVAVDETDFKVEFDPAGYAYDGGNEVKPIPKISLGDVEIDADPTLLFPNSNFTYTYGTPASTWEVGTETMDITVQAGDVFGAALVNYGGLNPFTTAPFKIVKADISDASIFTVEMDPGHTTPAVGQYNYTGEDVEPSVLLDWIYQYDGTIAGGGPAVTKGSKASAASTPQAKPITFAGDSDFELTYEENLDVGTATVTITAKSTSTNYTGSQSVTFKIVETDLAGTPLAWATTVPDQVFTGYPVEPELTIVKGTTVLDGTKDYEVEYKDNVDANITESGLPVTGANTPEFTAKGINNYYGTVQALGGGTPTGTFNIAPVDFETVEIKGLSATYGYTGSDIEPEMTLELTNADGSVYVLTEDVDYTATYVDNTDLEDTATITILPKSANFYLTDPTQPIEKTFKIVQASIADDTTVSGIAAAYVYTGSAIEPEPIVTTKDGKTLIKGTDYDLSYSDNVDLGTATITITGINLYQDTKVVTFDIKDAPATDLSYAVINGIDGAYPFTGDAIEPDTYEVIMDGNVLTEGVDYDVTYGANVDAGTDAGEITFTAVAGSAYTSEQVKTFTITAKDISAADVSDVEASYVETGSAIEPVPTVTDSDRDVTLVQDVDYVVAYADNVDLGTATITITGIGNYEGSKTVHFAVSADPSTLISIADATVDVADQVYTGSALEPAPVVTLTDGTVLAAGTDYTVNYANNVEVGTATVVVTGAGRYKDSVAAQFEITSSATTKTDIATATIAAIADQAHTGSAIEPAITVTLGGDTLVLDTDYTVAYSDNVDLGIATVTVTGIGDYEGTKTARFNIVTEVTPAIDISDGVIGNVNASYTYTGSEIKPVPTLTVDGTVVAPANYTVTYANNTAVGTATVTLTAAGNYTGSVSKTFEITEGATTTDIKDAVFSSIADQYYNAGNEIKPAFTVKLNDADLTADTDYTVAYSDNKEIGTATITITGAGDYTGTATTTFKIVDVEWNEEAVTIGKTDVITPVGQDPVENDDGSYTLPGGAKATTCEGKVTAELPYGTTVDKDGNITLPEDASGKVTLQTPATSTEEASTIAEITVPGGSTVATDGTVTVGKGEATVAVPQGAKIDVGEGSVIKAATVKDAEGKDVEVYQITAGEDGAKITINNKVIEFEAGTVITIDDSAPLGYYTEFTNPFTDVAATGWYYRDVQYVYENDLMVGTSTTTFEPDTAINRAMMATVLYNMQGQPDTSGMKTDFTDIKAGDWYYEKVLWAKNTGVVAGYSTTTFAPNDLITREQMAVMLYQYADKVMGMDVSKTTDLKGYTDTNQISDWAEAAMKWCNAMGIINGRSTTELAPKGYATRAELSSLLRNFETTDYTILEKEAE